MRAFFVRGLAVKVALITGGVRGIGRAVSLALAERGWLVAASYRTSETDARGLEEEIGAKGGRAASFRADISEPQTAKDLVRRVESEFGRIDALINCAGPYHRVHILEETVEDWNSMFASNLHSVFYLSTAAVPGMKERGWGRIVNFGLANADQHIGQPFITAHYIAKAGVLILTRSLAKALAQHGITVNAISPGFIDTGSLPLNEVATMVKNIPAGYVGTPQDAAAVVCFLVSDEARYINGANIHLSGAWGI
jgi:3-oxoacyl-[acyl-carrier protein] reductase